MVMTASELQRKPEKIEHPPAKNLFQMLLQCDISAQLRMLNLQLEKTVLLKLRNYRSPSLSSRGGGVNQLQL
jgi:hypothetical protein